MKRFLTVLAIFMVVFAGCDSGDSNGTDAGGKYDHYYTGTYRNNQDGTVEVGNESQYDMLLFAGTISINSIVGGVKAGSSTTVNFSTETDFQSGGYKILQAVKEAEFDAHSMAAAVDWKALITYRDDRRFRATISFEEGPYQYKVSNMSSSFFLELRKNSPEGEKITFLGKAETNKVIYCSNNDEITVFPVWINFDTETKSIVIFTPTDYNSSATVVPKLPGDVSSYVFNEPVDW